MRRHFRCATPVLHRDPVGVVWFFCARSKLSEADRIVTVFTTGHGKMRAVC